MRLRFQAFLDHSPRQFGTRLAAVRAKAAEPEAEREGWEALGSLGKPNLGWGS